jgi:hypothetical protein
MYAPDADRRLDDNDSSTIALSYRDWNSYLPMTRLSLSNQIAQYFGSHVFAASHDGRIALSHRAL